MAITITAASAANINYVATHLKKQSVVKDVKVTGVTGNSVNLRIYAEPAFMYETRESLPVTGGNASLATPVIHLNDGFFRQEMIEAQDAAIRIEVLDPDDGSVLGFKSIPVHVQPYLHWDGSNYPETTAGFQQPNSPLVCEVLKKAGELLAPKGGSLCGYQRDEMSVRQQCEAIYESLRQFFKISYISHPQSFENYGQKIRIAEEVLNEKIRQGTCLDLAILYASCLESAGLNPCVVLVPGHAFVACFLKRDSFKSPVETPKNYTPETWAQMTAKLLPVECTTFTAGSNTSFATAVSIGQRNMSPMDYICDTRAARNAGIVPVFTYTGNVVCTIPEGQSYGPELSEQEFGTGEAESRIELLRAQAMDVTTRSHLLNGEANSMSVAFSVDSEAFLRGGVKPNEVVRSLEGDEKKNSDILRKLFSRSRQNIRETGKSNLYATVNELIWQPEKADRTFAAPLYLCPAEIYRNTRGEYQLRMNPEEMIFNPALKVLLEQNYHLDSRKLVNVPGEQYAEQKAYLEYLIEHQKGWKVKENEGHLGLYSIPNEAIWRSLFDEKVLSHEIVQGILESKMSWDNQIEGTEEKKDCDLYIFETDSSQRDIISGAFRRKAQVIEGPAGNGKTQTLVNIMLDAILQGKKVLFVSEMAPAIEVAYEKLNEVMDGLFNIRIISGRNQAADVILQMRRTLNYLESYRDEACPEDVTETTRKYREALSYVEQYYEQMSGKTGCGKTVEELFAMYESYADCELEFNVDELCAGHTLSEAEEAVSILAKIMEEFDRTQGTYASYLCYDCLGSSEERKNLELAHTALDRYDKVWKSACHLRALLGIDVVRTEKEQLREMILMGRMLTKCPPAEDRRRYKAYLEEVEEALSEMPEEIRQKMLRGAEAIHCGRGVYLAELAAQVCEDYRSYSVAQKAASEKILRDVEGFAHAYPDLPRKVLFEEWVDKRQLDSNRSRRLYEGIISDMEKEGYATLIRQLEELRSKGANLNRKKVMDGFYKAWALYQLDKLQEELMRDRKFNYFIFQDKVEQLAEKEAVIRGNLPSQIFRAQLSRIPNISEGVSDNPELGVLQKLVRKKKTPVRTLFEEAPEMLSSLYPCMMMDPAAICEYIPSDFPQFDLVLIDEGSQMPTYDALAPIAHGKAVMIFGDEKQLQPRDEFRKRLEDDNGTIERESILTAGCITSMPRKQLRFHYRSENEGLISFSNDSWYNGDIITFPSPETRPGGVSYEFVPGSGDGGSVNEAEARAVIAKIRSIYASLPEGTDQTLGVITLNVHQRDKIQSLLLKEMRTDLELDLKAELISVLNLESCQGKEFDYVLLSPGFAADEEGKVSASMGLLNQENGVNRLNVMITRARKQMTVITGIDPSMLEGAKSEGVRKFKEFLEFAKGDLVLDSRVCDSKGRGAGLGDRVARELEKAGYEVHTQVGSSGFKVDLAVVSKKDPQKYAVGILLDHYRDGRSSIHDREVIYPKGLERKGWKIYRLRAMNWHMDPRHEVRQIIRMIESCGA